MRRLPPHISPADPGSYARYAVTVRQPRIIEQVVESNPVDGPARSALGDLEREIRHGVVTSPLPDGGFPAPGFDEEEKRTWEEQIAGQKGRTWLEIPWYFAESFFYLKLLVAFGYYGVPAERVPPYNGAPGPGDPFFPQKDRELLDPDGGLAMARRVLATVEAMGRDEALAFLLHSSLWGNRLDLSTFEVDESRRKSVLDRDAGSLLVDHTAESLSALSRADRIQVLLDNSGPELVCDLLLVDRLFSGHTAAERGPSSVILHAKKAPFFVSDATTRDTLRTIDALAQDGDRRVASAGGRLAAARRENRLRVQDHWFWNSALHFTAFPADLRKELGTSDVLLVKGDANYRRILEDRKWDTSLSLDDLAAYFPAPFIALRTMKSELVVDLPEEKVGQLSRIDSSWMVNGRRGLIRYCRVRK